jgi:hypothetical protein
MLRRVALVRTDFSEEHTISVMRVTKIGELGTTLGLTNNRNTLRRNAMLVFWLLVTANVVLISPILVTLMMEVVLSSKTPVHTRASRYDIPEDGILQG